VDFGVRRRAVITEIIGDDAARAYVAAEPA
jgi:hypothetical protein